MNKTIILPGNHDINITDKSSIWRAESNMFTSRNIRLIRSACALDLIQGHRCHVLDASGALVLLRDYLRINRDALLEYVKTGDWRGCNPASVWQGMFPMILDLPQANAVMFIVDSNDISANLVDNAFGFVEAGQLRRLGKLIGRYADRKQLFALHHHLALPLSLRSSGIRDRLLEKFHGSPQLASIYGYALAKPGHCHFSRAQACRLQGLSWSCANSVCSIDHARQRFPKEAAGVLHLHFGMRTK